MERCEGNGFGPDEWERGKLELLVFLRASEVCEGRKADHGRTEEMGYESNLTSGNFRAGG